MNESISHNDSSRLTAEMIPTDFSAPIKEVKCCPDSAEPKKSSSLPVLPPALCQPYRQMRS